MKRMKRRGGKEKDSTCRTETGSIFCSLARLRGFTMMEPQSAVMGT